MFAVEGFESTAFRLADARALATTVAWLRPCALAGQALAILVAVGWLHVNLPLPPLLAGIAVLAIVIPVVFWRMHKPWPVGEAEACGHVAIDILLFAWALYFTGGAANPFITLMLVPVALSAAALSSVATAAVTALAIAMYGVLIARHVPLADMPMGGHGFRLHLIGMAVNFGVAVLLLAVFIGRMRTWLNAERELLGALRERALRDEGILAIATQAADAAHQLNTPLSTLRTGLPELACGRERDAELCAELRVMEGEVDRCRDILRGMVDYGRQQLAGQARTTVLDAYVRSGVDRFRLLCPDAEVVVQVASSLRDREITVQPGLAHALLNLMRNACDASQRNGSNLVTLDVGDDDGRVAFTIGDRGGGFEERAVSLPMPSDKPHGLGIGLALARSTVERMHGEVRTQAGAGGTRVCVCLPLTGPA